MVGETVDSERRTRTLVATVERIVALASLRALIRKAGFLVTTSYGTTSAKIYVR